MKRLISLILAAALALAFAGCSKPEEPENEAPVMISGGQQEVSGGDSGQTEAQGASGSSGIAFEFDGVSVPLNVPSDEIIASLGEDYQYFEAQSCAFQGLDKVYTYGSFQIRTYTDGDTDKILSVEFLDDTISTPEGIYIGCSEDQVIAAYGSDSLSENGSYIIAADGGTLDIVMGDGTVSGISYNAAV